MPWISWNGHPLVLFDLPARKFHILQWTFWPQDFPLLAGLLIIAAFGLFAVTAWLGRVWCGYTCPQTVWTAIFMWAEQFCEGSRNQRIKRDKAPWNFDKIWRKTLKHLMWLGFAFLTGFTFVSYFSPAREMILELPFGLGFWEIAWIVFFTCATYINAGWMREQVCLYMCPYARFQSVMFDHDTLIVTYDKARGEPRGARKKGAAHGEQGLGDCVDCQICVQVCPTGIDIRDGLQYECINCALCIDGCNSVMEQMGYEKGLIRYATENSLEGKPTHFLRPRLIGYAAVMFLMVTLFFTALLTRTPLRLDVIRERDRLYVETSDGMIENHYVLKIMNMDGEPHRFMIRVEGDAPFTVVGEPTVMIESGDVAEKALRLQVDPSAMPQANMDIEFIVEADGNSQLVANSESRFIGPRVN